MNALQFALASFVAAGMLGISAMLLETLFENLRLPRRWLWLATIVASTLVPCGLALRTAMQDRVDARAPVEQAGPAVSTTESLIPTWVTVPALQLTQQLVGRDRSTSLEPIIRYGFMACLFVIPVLLLVEQQWVRRRKAEWRTELVDDVRVYVSERFGPAVVGLVWPIIVIPARTLELPPDDRRLLIAHEQEHVRAKDGLTLFVALLCIAVAPWNLPLWWQLSRLRTALEMDCDDRVLNHFARPTSYARLLLDMADGALIPVTATGFISRLNASLRRRVRRIIQPMQRASRVRVAGATLGAAIAIALALILPAVLVQDAAPHSVSASLSTYALDAPSESESRDAQREPALDGRRWDDAFVKVFFRESPKGPGPRFQEDSTAIQVMNLSRAGRHSEAERVGLARLASLATIRGDGAACAVLIGVTFSQAQQRKQDLAASSMQRFDRECQGAVFSDFFPGEADRVRRVVAGEPAERVYRGNRPLHVVKDGGATDVMMLNREGRWIEAEELGLTYLGKRESQAFQPEACAVLIGVTHAQHSLKKVALAERSLERFDRECTNVEYLDFFPRVTEQLRRMMRDSSR